MHPSNTFHKETAVYPIQETPSRLSILTVTSKQNYVSKLPWACPSPPGVCCRPRGPPRWCWRRWRSRTWRWVSARAASRSSRRSPSWSSATSSGRRCRCPCAPRRRTSCSSSSSCSWRSSAGRPASRVAAPGAAAVAPYGCHDARAPLPRSRCVCTRRPWCRRGCRSCRGPSRARSRCPPTAMQDIKERSRGVSFQVFQCYSDDFGIYLKLLFDNRLYSIRQN